MSTRKRKGWEEEEEEKRRKKRRKKRGECRGEQDKAL
jgi:hypothetical protein